MNTVLDKDEEITIKIQTLDNQIIINIKKNSTLLELKEKINDIINEPPNNQRLIYQGKILQNNSDKLKHYKIQNDSVLHLVVRKGTISEDNNNNVNNTNNNQNEENNSDFSGGLGFIRLNRNNRRMYRRNMHFDASDCIETLYQNILIINNLLKVRNSFNMVNFLQNKTIIPYNLSKRKFELGEWVDVKDTSNNWLEGQIINKRTLNNNKTQLLIHYNGWGVRWDEWIDQNSSRLAFFRTYTLQSLQSVLLSPNPTLVSDGNIEKNQKRPVDLFYYFNKISNIILEINKSIEKMNNYKKRNDNINNEDKEDYKEHNYNNNKDNNFIPFSFNELEIIQITSQLIPILDRCGRLMSDLSLLLSHTIFNPNLYPYLLLGHSANEINDSMSCTSGYSMLTNESSSLLSGFTGNFRFHQDRDVNLNNLRPIARTNNFSRVNQNLINTLGVGNSNSIHNNTPSNMRNNNSNNNSINIINTNNNINNINNNINNNNQFSRPHYMINSSNAELPFIQRLNFNNSMHQNYFNNNNTNLFDSFPKINLQIPPLLSPNQNNIIQPNNSLDEQNNIFLLNNPILVENSNNNNIINIINNNSIDRNQVQNDNTSDDNNFNQNLNNTFNDNKNYLRLPRRCNSGISIKTNKSADQMYTIQYKQFKIEDEQNNLMKNLNKDTGYYDSLSMKSDKIISYKNNKNLSYKSVSEVDEFGEYETKSKGLEIKKKDNIGYTTSIKSVESVHSKELESVHSKEFLDDDNPSDMNNNMMGTNNIMNNNCGNINNINNINHINCNSLGDNLNGAYSGNMK